LLALPAGSVVAGWRRFAIRWPNVGVSMTWRTAWMVDGDRRGRTGGLRCGRGDRRTVERRAAHLRRADWIGLIAWGVPPTLH
jgi:hypothetical protein